MYIFDLNTGIAQLGEYAIEGLQLLPHIRRVIIGGGEMCVKAFELDPGRIPQFAADRVRGLWQEAKPSHARIDFDMDLELDTRDVCGGDTALGKCLVKNRYAQFMLYRSWNRFNWDIAQHEYRRVNASLAQFERLSHVGNRQQTGAVLQGRARNCRSAVAIGIGFDHRHNRNVAADSRLYPTDVGGQRAQIDFYATGKCLRPSILMLPCLWRTRVG